MSRALPPHWAGPSAGKEVATKVAQLVQAKFEATHLPKPSPRLGRKGFLYLQKTALPVRAEEELRITARRMMKAERDERMDVTSLLTPVKQYMAGFTRPTDLRTSNWFPGGSYLSRNKVYESPVPEAYEPHTVFMLESRYNIRHGLGRVEAPEYIYGMCREHDLPAVLKLYNSASCGREVLELMDNARWPWGPQLRPHRPTKWWTDEKDRIETLAGVGSEPPPLNEEAFEDEDDDEKELEPMETIPGVKKQKAQQRVTALNPFPSQLGKSTVPNGDLVSSSTSMRAFHSSSVLFVGHSYNDDHIVPDFYVQRKQAKANKEEDRESEKPQLQDTSSLMDHLSDGILSDEIVASTRRLASKIPTELFNADGVLVHPSGFVIPTPSHSTSPERVERERDLAQQTAAVAERVLEEDYTDVTAETSTRRGKVPFEVRHEDGTVSHPSGFEPPTAADDFEHSGNSTVDSHIGQQPSVLLGAKRGIHTSASARAVVSTSQPSYDFVSRSDYLSTLDATPFWRPLLTLTVSTRPIGHTLLRLSKGSERGRPYHAEIDSDDRKCRISFKNRMRAMRIRRMQDLAVQMGQVLAGARGGGVGLRFSVDTMGRGIGGDGLENPLPLEHRIIGVGVAEHYRLADEVKELFRERGKDEIWGPTPFDIFGIDDFGRKLDAKGNVVPWSTPPTSGAALIKAEPWYKEYYTLKSASQQFLRHAQKKALPGSTKAKSVASTKAMPTVKDEDKDPEDEDEDLVDDTEFDDEWDKQPGSTLPIVRISAEPTALEQVLFSDKPLSLNMDVSELDQHNFLLTRPNGKQLIGPSDDRAKEMTVTLNDHLARLVVNRRLDVFYIAKRDELARILASRVNSVTYPDRFIANARMKAEIL